MKYEYDQRDKRLKLVTTPAAIEATKTASRPAAAGHYGGPHSFIYSFID